MAKRFSCNGHTSPTCGLITSTMCGFDASGRLIYMCYTCNTLNLTQGRCDKTASRLFKEQGIKEFTCDRCGTTYRHKTRDNSGDAAQDAERWRTRGM